MASEAQVVANRSNAQRSTGPRTPEGKAVVAQNAIKHGLLAREGVLRGEDPEEFERHREALLEQLNPAGPLEVILAARIVDLTWRLQRAAQGRNETFGALYDRHTAGTPEPAGPEERGATLGRMLLADYEQGAVLERLLRCERRIEGSLFRNLNELRRVHDQGRKADQEAANTLARWREEDDRAKKVRAFGLYHPADSSSRPDGGTMNTPGFEAPQPCDSPSWSDTRPAADALAGDEMCETNPICPEPDASQVPSSTAVMSDSAPNGLRRTKPISEEVSSKERQAASSPSLPTSHFAPETAAKPPGETNPIGDGLRDTGIPSASLSGQALHVTWNDGQDAHATETAGAGITGTVAEEELCETNPIGPEPDVCQVPCGTAVMSDSAPEALRKTNPICGGVSSLKCEVSSEQGQSCETNPIPGGADPDESAASPARPSREFQTDFVKQSQLAAKSLPCEGLGHEGAHEEEGRTPRPSFRPEGLARRPVGFAEQSRTGDACIGLPNAILRVWGSVAPIDRCLWNPLLNAGYTQGTLGTAIS